MDNESDRLAQDLVETVMRCQGDGVEVKDVTDQVQILLLSGSRCQSHGKGLHQVDVLPLITPGRVIGKEDLQPGERDIHPREEASDLRRLFMGLHHLDVARGQLDWGRADASRIDEARKLLDVLRAEVSQAATAVLCILLLGLRSRELLDRVVRDLDDDGWILVIERGKTERSNRKVKLTSEIRERLQGLAQGGQPTQPLFPARSVKGERLKGRGFHYATWLNDQVKAFCGKAGVPEVCVHGLRGTHASLAEEAGETAEAVAAALGHTSPKVTHDHYTMPDAVTSARQKKVLKVLAGGKR